MFSSAKLLQALLQNTLEQTFRQDSFRWLPPLPRSLLLDVSSSFVAMPAGHPSRAAGFGLTFYPSVALLISVVAVAVLQGDV